MVNDILCFVTKYQTELMVTGSRRLDVSFQPLRIKTGSAVSATDGVKK